MPTPDNPDEFFLLLALVTALFPLQWYLGRKLHKKSSAGTSFFHCLFAISNADFHAIRENESDEFKATLKAYERIFLYDFPRARGRLRDLFWVQVGVMTWATTRLRSLRQCVLLG